MKAGIFYEQKTISASVIAEIFRARLLFVLLEQGVIKQELINMLLSWNHQSGFNIHVRGQIAGTDGDAVESIARYMSRSPISVDRVEFNPADNTLTVYERKDRPSSNGIKLTPSWSLWHCSQFISLLLMKVSYIITVSIAARIGEREKIKQV